MFARLASVPADAAFSHALAQAQGTALDTTASAEHHGMAFFCAWGSAPAHRKRFSCCGHCFARCAGWAAAQFSAAAAPGSLPLVLGSGSGASTYSVPIQTLLFFTALSFLPAVLLMMTGFTRIVIVPSLLRQALGTQASPPNQVVIGLSLFLTFFVMGPTFDRVYQEAYVPYSTNAITSSRPWTRPRRLCAPSCSSKRVSRTSRCLFAWPG